MRLGKITLAVLILAASSFATTPPACQGYAHVRTITIDHTLAGTADTPNYVYQLIGTYSYLAKAASGGDIQHTVTVNGFTHPTDIAFCVDSLPYTRLPLDIDTYTDTTGFIVADVLIPNLSVSVDTTLYVAYGNTHITTSQEDPCTVWRDYAAVYHGGDGTSLSLKDSTCNGNDLTNSSSTATTGQLGGAFNLTTTQSLTNASPLNLPTGTSARSYELWFNVAANHSLQSMFLQGNNSIPM
jgi:hypothetical protein